MKPCALCTAPVEDNESDYCEFCQLLQRGEQDLDNLRDFIGEQALAELQVWIAEHDMKGSTDE